MNLNVAEIEKEIEGMSAEQKQSLLNTAFPAELEKQAEAQLASGDLADSLYALGGLYADQALAAADGVEKIAAEQQQEFDAAEKEISDAIDAGIEATGLNAIADESEMHKEAQAAAGLILAGYVDYLDKVAAADGGKLSKVKAMLGKAKDAVKGAAKKSHAHVMKHKGKYALGAGAAGGAAGMHLKNKMEKKAADLTVEQISDTILEKLATDAVVDESFEKIAGAGLEKAKAFAAKHYAKAKGAASAAGAHVKKHSGKYGLAGGVAAGAAGAHLASKK